MMAHQTRMHTLTATLSRLSLARQTTTAISSQPLRYAASQHISRCQSSYRKYISFPWSTRCLATFSRPSLRTMLPSTNAHFKSSSAITIPSSSVYSRGMKTRSSVKRLCDGCKPVRRKNRVFIICSKNAKHKQRQGK